MCRTEKNEEKRERMKEMRICDEKESNTDMRIRSVGNGVLGMFVVVE